MAQIAGEGTARTVGYDGRRFALGVRYTPGHVPLRADRDEQRVFVIAIRDERDEEPSWKVRCSIASEAFIAARSYSPTDADLVEYFLNRVEAALGEYVSQPPSETYLDLFVEMDEYPLWERHLRDRRN